MNDMVDTARMAMRGAEAPASAAARTLEIRFTGSGSEYFRIWIVNLLLIVVTLGWYMPFAKARRIRYFYANTVIDGQALGFHGDPWKMFRGFVLLIVLTGSYAIAGHLSPFAGLLAFLVLCAVWPALWRASMQFRLGNTSWRGLRMGFGGRLQDAYRAVAPLYLPLIAFIGLSLFAEQGAAGEDDAGRTAQMAHGAWVLLSMAVVAAMGPWFLTLAKRYQHNGYRIARQKSHIELPGWWLYKLSVKAALLLFAFMALGGVALFAFSVVARSTGIFDVETFTASLVLASIVSVVLFYATAFLLAGPYFATRLQNLTWNNTRSEAVTFTSQLRARSLCALTAKNWLLVALTLGLYRPFAAIHTARMRLEAVSLTVTEDVASWSALPTFGDQDATGEASGDFFGIDMSL